ncbi:1,4-alpha-glucan branching protein GlgB [Lachnospiraceae bacterium ZAX-1]
MDKISEVDMYLFGEGTHYDIYKKLGAHPTTDDGEQGVHFAVWAPNATSVSVIGTFNQWKEHENEMQRLNDMGLYELFIPNVVCNDLYKYYIETKNGKKLYKADPFANYAELRPGTASAVADIKQFDWTDTRWMDKRAKIKDPHNQPIAIYEVHPGSWRRHFGQADDGLYTYQELAHSLADYVKEMGYTHVELMGISEYPFDGSWGYQVTGYYAPTSRYGTPKDFMYLVDYLHKKNIGVILDWVPAHFPRDAHGLAEFDGSCLYEYADPRKGEHPDWGTKIFDYGKHEVKNFLIGSALLWIEHYHVDGIRVDAVASMLYLDYGKNDGQWVANQYGENKNLEAIEFFRHLNTVVTRRNPGALMIAEESTAWPMVTGVAEKGGLNFTYKWNMGWMHDFLSYMQLDPVLRKGSHHKLTFGMSYNSSEHYILVISHDEVVHLKCSMINKMPGNVEEDKFLNLKVGYAFMIGHPGKKLLFMGQEFAHLREWSEERELDWFLLEKKEHVQIQDFMKALLKIYTKYPAMYEGDTKSDNFEWTNADDAERSIYSFIRKSSTGRNNLLFVFNFTPVERDSYRVGVSLKRQYKLILSSDDKQFGGSGKKRLSIYKPEKKECDGKDYSFPYKLPAYGVAVFVY